MFISKPKSLLVIASLLVLVSSVRPQDGVSDLDLGDMIRRSMGGISEAAGPDVDIEDIEGPLEQLPTIRPRVAPSSRSPFDMYGKTSAGVIPSAGSRALPSAGGAYATTRPAALPSAAYQKPAGPGALPEANAYATTRPAAVAPVRPSARAYEQPRPASLPSVRPARPQSNYGGASVQPAQLPTNQYGSGAAARPAALPVSPYSSSRPAALPTVNQYNKPAPAALPVSLYGASPMAASLESDF